MLTRQELEALVRMHQAELFRYLRYLGTEEAGAEDLVQETFLAACRAARPPERDDAALRAAWLRGIARNLFYKYCRSRRASPVQADLDSLGRSEQLWKDEFLRGGDGFDYLEALRACLEQTPERARAALDLRYAQGKSRQDMARALAMSEDGVKSLLRRIRASLGECIRHRLGLEQT